jgi:hypothetical protein
MDKPMDSSCTKFSWKFAFLFLVFAMPAKAQTCFTAGDMDPAIRAALGNTAQRYFGMITQGDVASLRQNAIASLAGNFTGIEAAVTQNKTILLGAQPTARPPFLLKAQGTAPLERAEFLCGVFNKSGQTSNSAVFVIPNLPPGDYGIVILDTPTAKERYTVSFVLQQDRTAWKLAGLYIKSTQVAGHDGAWYADRARQFKAKGQMRNAWFYSLLARSLLAPVDFMNDLTTDKLYDEFQSTRPTDFPPSDLTASGKTYKITTMFLLPVENNIDLIMKYESPNISNSGQTFQDNQALIRALVAKFPEFRDGFDAVVARAVEPSGRDFGTMLTMKDIK